MQSYGIFVTLWVNMERICFTLLALWFALGLRAADADSAAVRPPHQLREVEVLGVKQMPSTGSTPVTNIDAATINRLNIKAVKEAAELVPNFFIPQYGSRMTSSIYMRGMGSRIDHAVVGLSVDGVAILNKDAYDFDIADISRMEVARGAQSVLNGQNAMAGQINIYTLSPRDFQGWRAQIEYGKANTSRVAVGGYFKLSSGLFTSLSAYYNRSDGFWTNEYNNTDIGGEKAGGARWKTVFTPSRALSITNTAAFGVNNQNGYPYASAETGRIAYNDTCFYKRSTFSDGLTVAWAGKRVVVTSLTSVQYIDDNMTLDQDFTAADYFTLTQKRKEWTLTQDLFTKGTRGNYSWLGGVYAFGRKGDMQAPVTFFNTGIEELIESKANAMNPTYPISWDKREFLLASDFTTKSGGVALYHESSLDVGRFTFDVGLRWDIEQVECDYHSDADASYTIWHVEDDGSRSEFGRNPVSIHDRGTLKQTFNELLPKLSITYRIPQGYVFMSAAKGYKMGGINTQMFSDVLQQRVMETLGLTMAYTVDEIVCYRPETSWNYELGTKLNLLDGRLSTEVVAFFIDCRDQQLTVFPPGMVTGRIMTNAGETYSRGLELSATYRPTDDLRFSASYGYTRATFHKYNNGREDLAGKRVPYAPAHTLFASALWQIPTTIGPFRPSINLTLRAVGDIMWNEANTAHQPFYALPGASLMLQADGLSLKIWGENLTNTAYNTFRFTSMNKSFVQTGMPITFGATLRITLNETN